MWRACSCLALLIAGVVSCGSTADADDHRVLVLDIGRYPNNRPGSDRHQLVMLVVESGKVVAHAELGLKALTSSPFFE